MKKYISGLLFLGLLASTTVSAKETYKLLEPHKFYFGGDCLQLNLNEQIKDIQIKGTKSLAGIRLGYEYLDPWAFYAGIDIASAISSHSFCVTENKQTIDSCDRPIGIANLDVRLGYTIGSKRSTYTPFLGTGCYSIGSVTYNRGFHEGWLYLSSGLRSMFNINHVFSMGVNLKATKAVFGFSQFKNHDLSVTDHRYPWGGEVGVPFVWSFNPARTWTFQLEPYWGQLNFSRNQQVLGSKFLINAQF